MGSMKPKNHKNRRKRNKPSNYDQSKTLSGMTSFALAKLTAEQPKKRKRNLRQVHPSPVEIGITPSQVDGPSNGDGRIDKHWVVIGRFFIPMLIALILGMLFKPESSKFGANTPFVEGDVRAETVTYNPETTGIEYTKTMEIALVRPNITYARIFGRWNLGESKYRNYQWIYIYAIIGRQVPDTMTEANGTYTYYQHMRTSLSAFTFDNLGEVVLVQDYDMTRRVSCKGRNQWCRKVPVAVVSEINFPKYELTVRFSRPAKNVGDGDFFNSTVPIMGKVTYEYVSEYWLFFEIVIRYGFNIVSMGMFFWPHTGLWSSLKRRPVEDFTASRCFGVLLFLALFFFNDPFFLFQVFIPDAQMTLRKMSSCTTTLAVAIYLGYITHVIYSIKFSPPSPPSLIVWVTEAKKKAAEIDEEEERIEEEEDEYRERTGLSPTEGRPKTPLYPNFDRPPKAYLKTPIFFLSSAKYLVEEDDDDDDEESKYAGKRVLPSKKKTIKKRKKGISIAEEGYMKFFSEFRDQTVVSVLETLKEERGGVNTRTVWRDIIGPFLITAAILCVWITAFEVYLAQLNNGPTPRPRLTFFYAYNKHPSVAIPMVNSVAFQSVLLLGCLVYASEEVSLTVKAHVCFLGITLITGVLLILATLNCSYYPLGTPFLEVITSRTLLNCYAWVVSFMIKPLETVNGRFPKRADDGEGEYESSSEEESEEEEEVVKSKPSILEHKELKIPTMSGVVSPIKEAGEDSSDRSGSDSESESGSGSDGDDVVEDKSGSLESGSEYGGSTMDSSSRASYSVTLSESTRRSKN